jgi:hypothetical protein
VPSTAGRAIAGRRDSGVGCGLRLRSAINFREFLIFAGGSLGELSSGNLIGIIHNGNEPGRR